MFSLSDKNGADVYACANLCFVMVNQIVELFRRNLYCPVVFFNGLIRFASSQKNISKVEVGLDMVRVDTDFMFKFGFCTFVISLLSVNSTEIIVNFFPVWVELNLSFKLFFRARRSSLSWNSARSVSPFSVYTSFKIIWASMLSGLWRKMFVHIATSLL